MFLKIKTKATLLGYKTQQTCTAATKRCENTNANNNNNNNCSSRTSSSSSSSNNNNNITSNLYSTFQGRRAALM